MSYDPDRSVIVTSVRPTTLSWTSTERERQRNMPDAIFLVWCQQYLLGFATEAEAALSIAERYARRFRVPVIDRTLETWPG